MSIIIRMQNLPWAANSLDIRRYFQGLGIPEGGVHIVGGDKGDAFIAFSTDEDARQAMERDAGKIKEVRIKLLLSSRAEMQRVIDQARAQHANPAPPKKEERRRPSPEDRGRRGPTSSSSRDRSPRRRRRDRSHSRSPSYRRDRDKERSRSSRGDERRRSFEEPVSRGNDAAPLEEPNKPVQNGSEAPLPAFQGTVGPLNIPGLQGLPGLQALQGLQSGLDAGLASLPLAKPAWEPDRKSTWDDKQPSGFPSAEPDKSSAAPATGPLFPISSTSPAMRPQGDGLSGPVNMAGQPLLPGLGGLNLASMNMMNAMMGGPSAGGDMMGMMAGNMPSNMSGSVAGGMGANMPLGMGANMGGLGPNMGAMGQSMGGMAANMAGMGANLPGGMGTNMSGGMGGAMAGGMAGVMPGVMGGAMAGGMGAAMPGSMGMGAMGANMGGSMGGNMMGGRGPMGPNAGPGFNDRRPISDGAPAFGKTDPGPEPPRRAVADAPGPTPARDSSSSRRNEESCCVEMRGLTGEPTPRDVKDFFRGLRIFSGCIRVATAESGVKTLVIRFANKWDAREALHGNYKNFGGDAITLVPFPEELFERTEYLGGGGGPPPSRFGGSHPGGGDVGPGGAPGGGGRGRFPPRDDNTVVVMKGLPYSCSETDVLQFFSGLNILDLFVEHDHNGRATGTGFVEFASKRDFDAAMNMHRRKMGHRYIELTVGTRDSMHLARNADGVRPDGPAVPPRTREEEAPHHSPIPPAPLGHGSVPLAHTCVSMLGLPDTVTDRDIADFFSTQGVIPRAIHIMLGANGVPTGHAFAEFAAHADCERAFLKNGASLGPHTITLKTIPYSEVAQALGGHHRPPPPENRFEGGPPRGRDHGPPVGRELGGPGPVKRPLLERAERPPLFPDPAEERRGPLFPDRNGPPGPLLRAPRRFDDGEGPRGPSGPPVPAGPGSLEGFGKPGCVVTATNIPFRAGVDDIIAFFHGFDLTKEKVMRRFSDRGQPTGDARIAFASPREAQEALAKFNNRPMQGRAITLGLL
ncbi:unnamed protein product [Ixodes pacificus]